MGFLITLATQLGTATVSVSRSSRSAAGSSIESGQPIGLPILVSPAQPPSRPWKQSADNNAGTILQKSNCSQTSKAVTSTAPHNAYVSSSREGAYMQKNGVIKSRSRKLPSPSTKPMTIPLASRELHYPGSPRPPSRSPLSRTPTTWRSCALCWLTLRRGCF